MFPPTEQNKWTHSTIHRVSQKFENLSIRYSEYLSSYFYLAFYFISQVLLDLNQLFWIENEQTTQKLLSYTTHRDSRL